MIIRLIANIDSPPEGDRFHWLHCSHGKFPNYAGVFEDGLSRKFIGAIWEVSRSPLAYAVAVDCPENVCRGLLQTYHWSEVMPGVYKSFYNRKDHAICTLTTRRGTELVVLVKKSIRLAMRQGV